MPENRSPADLARSAPPLARVAAFAARERLFRRTEKVIAAVSGGPDSVACLLLLLELREQLGFEVVAAHFDHRLREDSRADLGFVAALCERLGVRCVTGEGDVREAAARDRCGLEAAARRMRYDFLGFVAGKEQAERVVTGHTADDQAETVAMRIVRGTGVRGLRGMLPLAPLPGTPAIGLARPLLVLTRSESAAVCAGAGIAPRTDPTNEDRAHLRNRMRHETMAALRAVNPSVREALLGLAASAREAFAAVEAEALAARPLERAPFGSTFALAALRALQPEALVLVVEREAAFHGLETAVNRTRVHNLAAVLARGSGETAFGEAIVEVSCGQVRIGPALAAAAFVPRFLDVPGTVVAGQWRVEVATAPFAAPAALTVSVDRSELRGALRVRPLAPGDRLDFRGGSRRVSDILANAKVPRWARRGCVGVADGAGLVAIAGGPADLAQRAPAGSDDALYLRFTLVVLPDRGGRQA